MLFNSQEFIFLFLPVSFIVYFLLNRARLLVASRAWLVLASLFFYGYWNSVYVFLILISILFNYSTGTALSKYSPDSKNRKLILLSGISINLGALTYYKYADFFISNLNWAGVNIPLLHVVLPLGISFFTFTQIAYLVDCYRGEVKEYDLLNYSLFVTFFPHLIAGPILHHKDLMPQFESHRKKIINFANIAQGLYLFSLGLFKKVMIADTFSVWATQGFDQSADLGFVQAWVTALSYTFQLYFDFSGYIDMALGAALFFNISLPVNFNSPYKATDIQDFWRRWHITLSCFLREYLYIPLGGNKNGEIRTYLNLFVTFLLGGIWHGANWTFVFWGALHGFAAIIHRLWQKTGLKLHPLVGWLITFNFVNITWVFFRAKTWQDATKVLRGMFCPVVSGNVLSSIHEFKAQALWILCFTGILLFAKNSSQMKSVFKPDFKTLVFCVLLAVIALTNLSKVSEFIYFNF